MFWYYAPFADFIISTCCVICFGFGGKLQTGYLSTCLVCKLAASAVAISTPFKRHTCLLSMAIIQFILYLFYGIWGCRVSADWLRTTWKLMPLKANIPVKWTAYQMFLSSWSFYLKQSAKEKDLYLHFWYSICITQGLLLFKLRLFWCVYTILVLCS